MRSTVVSEEGGAMLGGGGENDIFNLLPGCFDLILLSSGSLG